MKRLQPLGWSGNAIPQDSFTNATGSRLAVNQKASWVNNSVVTKPDQNAPLTA